MSPDPTRGQSMADYLRDERLKQCLQHGEMVDAKRKIFESGSDLDLGGLGAMYVRVAREGNKCTFEQQYKRKEWVDKKEKGEKDAGTKHLEQHELVCERASYMLVGERDNERLVPLTYEIIENGVKRAELQLKYDEKGKLVGENVYIYDSAGEFEQGAETEIEGDTHKGDWKKIICQLGKNKEQVSERVVDNQSPLTSHMLVSVIGNAKAEIIKSLHEKIVWKPTEEAKLRHGLEAIDLAQPMAA